MSQNEIERGIARSKSYVGSAVVVFFLYLLFYIPGLVVNILYLRDAYQTHQVGGQMTPGTGCLIALLVINGVGALLACMALAFVYEVFSS